MALGSGIRKKPIPDPGSRGQKGTGSRIPDPDPQHCFLPWILCLMFLNSSSPVAQVYDTATGCWVETVAMVSKRCRRPDPESGSTIRQNAGSGSALNQIGSATLPLSTLNTLLDVLKLILSYCSGIRHGDRLLG
jgi:hypothetical protein